MKNTLAVAVLCALASTAYAQSVPPFNEPACQSSCNESNQSMGDTSSSADNSQSEASQSNPSSNSNSSQSGNTIDPSIQQSGNTVSQSGNQSSTSSSDATGNVSSNDTRSTANNGGMSNTSTTTSGGIDTNVATKSGPATTTGGNIDAAATTNSGDVRGGRSDSNSAALGGSSVAGGGSVGNTSARGGRSTSGSLSSTGPVDSHAGVGQSGNSSTHVDASDRSIHEDNSRFTVIPPVVPPTPPSAIGNGPLPVVTLACGPLMQVVQRPVQGYYMGWFKTKHMELGYTDTLRPVIIDGQQKFYDEVRDANGDKHWIGSQAIVFTTVIGTAAGRNVALGGGSGRGDWGQAGGGSTASVQQLVTRIIVVPCDAGAQHVDLTALPVVRRAKQ